MADLLFELLPVLLAQLLLLSYTITYLQSLILESGFCDSGESWETKLFYRREAGRGLWGQGESGDLAQEDPIGSCSVTYLFNMLMEQLLVLHTH